MSIMSDPTGNVNFSYMANGVIPMETKSLLQEEFIGELTYVIDCVLKQAETKITGLKTEDAWKLINACAYRMHNQAENPVNNMERKSFTDMDFELFMQQADTIVPGVVDEIERRYGYERLSKAVTPGDIISSIQEKMTDCAWLYLKAKNAGNQELMFACAKQLYAAKNNQYVVSTILDELNGLPKQT